MTIKSYYNFDKLLSYNATMNFLVGGRGLGKTFGAKKKGITSAIKSPIEEIADELHAGNQFMLVRRYQEELKLSKNTFFADIQSFFPKHDFKSVGIQALMAPIDTRGEKKRKWIIIGFFIPLSIAQNFKGVSFPNVKIIIFDEFIIEKGNLRYLPDEAKVFMNFYSTVDRYKDKTRVLFLANSVAINNPYFIAYKIDPRKADENGFIRLFNGYMLAHFPNSDDFENEVYQTKFGKFIAGSEYAEYAVGNAFADNHDALIKSKPQSAIYMFTLETLQGRFSVWYDVRTDNYFALSKLPKAELLFTIINEKMDENKTLMTFSDKPLGNLRTAYRHGKMWFDRPSTRNSFLEIFKR